VGRRRALDKFVKGFSWVAASLGIALMFWIIAVCVQRGIQAWNWDFFTQLPTPPGEEGGGVANAIVGTLVMTGLATALGVPVGFFAGVFLAEFGKNSRFAHGMRSAINVMMGIPSIVVGLFAYTLLVPTLGTFSGWAGAFALAVIMLPVMARTTEDILNLVPNEMRESALAVGAARWRATLGVVVKAARAGLLTGAILAVVRVSGETAPLLFTALNSPYWTINPDQPYANLTVTIYNYAKSPFPDWIEKAWGASLLIIVMVLGANIIVRLIAQRGKP
jgi:phosphate transport system permease protein